MLGEKFHAESETFLYLECVSMLNPRVSLILFLGVISNKNKHLQWEQFLTCGTVPRARQNRLNRATLCLEERSVWDNKAWYRVLQGEMNKYIQQFALMSYLQTICMFKPENKLIDHNRRKGTLWELMAFQPSGYICKGCGSGQSWIWVLTQPCLSSRLVVNLSKLQFPHLLERNHPVLMVHVEYLQGA